MIQKNFYIMGKGKLGDYLQPFLLSKGFRFLGFLDNMKQGNLIFKPEDISDKNIKVYIASINYMYELEQQLRILGFTNITSFAELTTMYPELMTYNQAYYNLQQNYLDNRQRYNDLYNMLSDEYSQKVLDTIIKYRLTLDASLYSTICNNINDQYFEDFVPYFDTFVDAGGFDGDTTLRLLQKYKEAETKIYFFEPDKISFYKAINNLSQYKNITFYQYGLSDHESYYQFNSDGTVGSSICEYGNTSIKCVALNDIIPENLAFLKFDIEGFELNALRGCTRFLKSGSPLAVCVYHKPEDIYIIPEFIKSVNKNYKFYLRHYTTSIFDTVLYAII